MDNEKKYTSTVEVQDYWINKIAPNYFDFDNVNNYRSGIFGYINEVMSTVTMDTHQSIKVARREFYPVSAQNPQSIYKMAALQKINLPMAIPATCKSALLLDRDEILANSTYKNGIYSCVIDNTATILANDIPFSFLYPIVILSNNTNGEWTHTIHYDKSFSNSLDKDVSSGYYITNKTITQDGKKYLMMGIMLYQTKMEAITQLVSSDSLIKTVSLLFQFEGDLANFEVFYTADPDTSSPIQLVKLMEGQAMVESPFCYYRLVNDNMIELTFPKNIYFTPELNSEITLNVYTSLGKKGEFPSFTNQLSCTMDSENYPYNNNMTMIGYVNGKSANAKDKPTFNQYVAEVQKAYATNDTITTTSDLQFEFNAISSDSKNKVIFRKKRADAFERTYGAYCLLKDNSGNVVPTNTLSVSMKLEDFDSYSEVTQRAFIKPGTLFEYDPSSDNKDIYTAMKVTDLTLADDLSEYDSSSSRFLYTNPFLIGITLNPNLVGYYNNSINDTKSVQYNYINDSSVIQFIGSSLKINRNAINNENFYKFSLTISPTTEIDPKTIVGIPTPDEDEDYYIRAKQNGKIVSTEYVDNSIICTIQYDDGETEDFQLSSNVVNNDGEYVYTPGYELQSEVYSSFIEGDIIAIKKVTDLGKIRACLNIGGILYENGLYIPMTIEGYDKELNAYTLCGYLSTDDIMDNGGTLLIEQGIMNTSGYEDDNISIPYTGLKLDISVFYLNDDMNFTHKYSEFDYFKKHTMTNSYVEDSENGIDIITHIDYIRSTILFEEDTDTSLEVESSEIEAEEDESDIIIDDLGEDDITVAQSEDDAYDDYIITIKEIPFTKANWIKTNKNYNYLIDSMMNNYNELQSIYKDLDNNYGIDLKFYNTYGKSKFFKAGIKKTWEPLSRVNCSFRFGVYLSSVANQSTFLSQFRNYVKEYVEAINSTGGNQSIYILSMIKNIQEKFSEIGYVEYYGFDEHETNIQKIEPIPTSEMSDELLSNYIPEFINICTYVQNGENVPDIQVEFLNDAEE